MDEAAQKEFKKAFMISIAILIIAPVIYLMVAYKIDAPAKTGGEVDLLFYIFLIMGMIQPAVGFIVVRHQLAAYRKQSERKMTPAQLLTTLAIIKAAVIEAGFIYGLVLYLMSGDMQRMLIFYPIGAIWAAILWPRRAKWENTIQTLET